MLNILDAPTEERLNLIETVRLAGCGHISTVIRWIKKGVKRLDGTVVRLQAVRLGGRWHTTRAALMEFVEATTPTFGSVDSTIRSPSQRNRDSERAAAALEKIGV